jgi:hypothetical protein
MDISYLDALGGCKSWDCCRNWWVEAQRLVDDAVKVIQVLQFYGDNCSRRVDLRGYFTPQVFDLPGIPREVIENVS